MALGRIASSTLRHFAANRSGTVAVTFALAVVPLLLASGMAIDYVRYANAETDLQSALDGAALSAAAAVNLSNSERLATANSTFDQNLIATSIQKAGVTSSFKINGGQVIASASL